MNRRAVVRRIRAMWEMVFARVALDSGGRAGSHISARRPRVATRLRVRQSRHTAASIRAHALPSVPVTWVAFACLSTACTRTEPPAPATPPTAASTTTTTPTVAPSRITAPPPSAEPTPSAPPPAAPAPAPANPDATPAPLHGFLGGDDTGILRGICDAPVVRLERNRGGSTISFRTWFDTTRRGLFKPQQQADVANFRAEIAAYRLSRLLGLHRVPPACGRSMPRARLQTAADQSNDPAFAERAMRELLGRGDDVPGAMLHWVPGPLEPVPGVDRWRVLLDGATPIDPADTTLAADLSALLVFDFLTNNVDRWSGGNILRQRVAGAPGPMLFMDNGASFTIGVDGQGAQSATQWERIASVHRFPRRLIQALRALDEPSLRRAMGEDPLGAALGPQQIRAVLARRDRLVAHVDALVRSTGEANALPFP